MFVCTDIVAVTKAFQRKFMLVQIKLTVAVFIMVQADGIIPGRKIMQCYFLLPFFCNKRKNCISLIGIQSGKSTFFVEYCNKHSSFAVTYVLYAER